MHQWVCYSLRILCSSLITITSSLDGLLDTIPKCKMLLIVSHRQLTTRSSSSIILMITHASTKLIFRVVSWEVVQYFKVWMSVHIQNFTIETLYSQVPSIIISSTHLNIQVHSILVIRWSIQECVLLSQLTWLVVMEPAVFNTIEVNMRSLTGLVDSLMLQELLVKWIVESLGYSKTVPELKDLLVDSIEMIRVEQFGCKLIAMMLLESQEQFLEVALTLTNFMKFIFT